MTLQPGRFYPVRNGGKAKITHKKDGMKLPFPFAGFIVEPDGTEVTATGWSRRGRYHDTKSENSAYDIVENSLSE